MAALRFVLCLTLCLSTNLVTGLALRSSLVSQVVEDGYEVFPSYAGSRYKLSTFRLDWADALSACQGDGGDSHLVIVNTQAEAEVVKTLMTRLIGTGNTNAHVGIDDIATEGTWLTVKGGPVTDSGYNKWSEGQPNEGTDENCGYVAIEALYYDGPCSQELPFICEKPDEE